MNSVPRRKTYLRADAIARIDARLDHLAQREARASGRHTPSIDQERLRAANMPGASRAEEIERAIAEITACHRALDGELAHSSPPRSPSSLEYYASRREQSVPRNEPLRFQAPRQAIEALETEVDARAARLAGIARKPTLGP